MKTAQVGQEKTDPVSLYPNKGKFPHIKIYLIGLLFLLLLIIAFFIGFHFYQTKQLPWQGVEISSQGIKVTDTLVKGGEYLILEKIDAYVSPEEKTPVGYIISGKYFLVLEQKGEWIHIRMTRTGTGQAANGWIKFSKTAYQLVENK